MESPFIFGKVVTDDKFVNRTDEIRRLQNNFKSGNNTILISPRRWGKTSLVLKAANELADKEIRFVFINIQTIRDEESFFTIYSQEIIKATISKKEEILNTGKEFFKRIIPRFSFGLDPQADLSISFDWKEAMKAKDEILNLPETIALKKKIKIVICLDEFQSINKFNNTANFEQELRSYWMHHQHVAYCIYGSRKHMMLEIFNSENRPFYRFGDLVLLTKIQRNHWINYIVTQFNKTGKTITQMQADKIASLANNHSYYIQQLANEIWLLAGKEVTDETIDKGTENVITTNAIFYQETAENLSNTQINLLKAIADKADQFFSVDTMKKYNLGTPRNVSKNKLVMENKDIIDFSVGTQPSFVDPFFELWFKKNY